MGMLAAFVFGYWMGTRAGQDGIRKMRHTSLAILQSDEFQTTVAGMAGMARGALQQSIEAAMTANQRSSSRAA